MFEEPPMPQHAGLPPRAWGNYLSGPSGPKARVNAARSTRSPQTICP